jgi:DHA2 family multidrug resistance protein
MSTATLAPSAAVRPAINPWLVAVAVVIPTFMEVLDTTIANVALRYIAGGLSAAVIDSEWVLTSYLAANATILPISGWLSTHLGHGKGDITGTEKGTSLIKGCFPRGHGKGDITD